MNLQGILHALLGGGTIQLQNWTASHNTHPLGTAQGTTHVTPTAFEASFEFKEHNNPDKIHGKRPLVGSGPHTVALNGTAVAGGHIALRLHLHGVQPRLEVRFVLKTSPEEYYRFDADVVETG